MKKTILTLFLFLLSSIHHQAVQAYELSSQSNLPGKMLIREEVLAWTTTFNIEAEDRKLGSVYRKLLSWTPEYDFVNYAGDQVAKGKMRFFSLTVIFDVTDTIGNQLGKVQEVPYTFFPTFEIVSPQGTILAVAKMNFWKTKYVIKTYDGRHFATMSRNFFRLKDDWRLEIHDQQVFLEKEIDPRMLILLAVFQTDRDYWSSIKNQETLSVQVGKKPLDTDKMMTLLEPYRAGLHGVMPTARECEELELIVEDVLACQTEQAVEEEAVLRLIELLDSDRLAVGHKGALFLLLQQKLRSESVIPKF